MAWILSFILSSLRTKRPIVAVKLKWALIPEKKFTRCMRASQSRWEPARGWFLLVIFLSIEFEHKEPEQRKGLSSESEPDKDCFCVLLTLCFWQSLRRLELYCEGKRARMGVEEEEKLNNHRPRPGPWHALSLYLLLFLFMLPLLSYPSERLNWTGNFDTAATAERCNRGRARTRTFTSVAFVRSFVRPRPGSSPIRRRTRTRINLCPYFNLRGAKTEGRTRKDDRFFLRDCNAIEGHLRFSRESCAFLWRSSRIIIYHSNMFFREKERERGGGHTLPDVW